MDPKDVFDSQAVSIEGVMREPGRGLYIPSYQRNYAWKKDQVRALIASICEGASALVEMEDAITFIGTFIFVHDRAYATVEPQVKHDLPAAVYLVIDGQQRLTTLAMVAVALHNYLVSLYSKTKAEGVVAEWLEAQYMGLVKRLERMFALDKDIGYGDETLRYYPRIIRAHDDSWSNREKKAAYNSPIARILRAYIVHWLTSKPGQPIDEFTHTPTDSELDKLFAENFRAIQTGLRGLFESKKNRQNPEEEEHLPDLARTASNSSSVLERFFHTDVPQPVVEVWSQPSPKLHDRRVAELSRAFLFTNYFLNRVAVTQVLVKKEDYAFDLFEALNTTGEPLTAYETFKPLVIKSESLAEFQKSPSAESILHIEAFLNSYGEKRREASHRLLISFALYTDGTKLGKGLREQRNWLRSRFDGGVTIANKRSFLDGMATISDFLHMLWPESPDKLDFSAFGVHATSEALEKLRFALTVLRDAKHDVTVALLARFYEQVTLAAPPSKQRAIQEFVSAALSVTAFYALWRGSRAGTDNIDAVYRKLMQGLIDDEQGAKVPAFHRNGGHAPSVDRLRSALRGRLNSDGILSPTAWCRRAAQLPVYKQSVPLTRLLLLAIAEDAVPNPDDPSVLVRGKAGCAPMLTLEKWRAGFQVEHIAPQSPTAEWDRELYALARTDTLGNLVLLPGAENIAVSNRAWPLKQLYYRVLAEETHEAATTLVKQAASAGVEISDARESSLRETVRHLPHLRGLAALPKTAIWDVNRVEQRSQAAAVAAWNTLAPWLGISALAMLPLTQESETEIRFEDESET